MASSGPTAFILTRPERVRLRTSPADQADSVMQWWHLNRVINRLISPSEAQSLPRCIWIANSTYPSACHPAPAGAKCGADVIKSCVCLIYSPITKIVLTNKSYLYSVDQSRAVCEAPT